MKLEAREIKKRYGDRQVLDAAARKTSDDVRLRRSKSVMPGWLMSTDPEIPG